MADLGYLELLREAEREANRVDDSTRFVDGAPQARKDGARQYVEKIEAFMEYIQHRTRRHNTPREEFQRYKSVVQNLVDRGEFKPERLKDFG